MSIYNKLNRGGCLWGFVRLVAAILILLLLVQFGRLMFERIDTGAAMAGWNFNDSFLESWPGFVQRFLAFLFSGVLFRYIYFPLAGFVGVILLLALYVQKTYQLPRFRIGLRYVLATLFGVGYPILRVVDGKKKIDPKEINLLDLKGGSGFLQVGAGSVVLIENFEQPVNVLSTGQHFISQTELIKDVNNLEDQHGYIERVPAVTKDGIPIEMRDIHYRFRVRSGQPPWYYADRTPEKPYPYSRQAVRDIAYNRSVTSQGMSSWQKSVELAVQSAITNYISETRIDDLTAPPRDRLTSIRTRARFRQLGADLLWVDIGHFDILKKDERDPRPKKWGEVWVGASKTQRAFGEGERLYYQELGRAEAEAEILSSILEALERTSLSDDPRINLRKIILTRTAQVLEAMTDKQPSPELPPKTRRVLRRPRRRRRR
jgi:hypothetical protein